jgi:ferritin-like metal-binding protein YciE
MLLNNLSDLFQRGLEYAWDSEQLLQKELPNLIEAASSDQLKQVLQQHQVETKGHIYHLKQIFTRLERSPAGEKGEPIRIILKESEKMIAHLDRSPLLDAALIFSGNQAKHYEIGLYESLAAFARTLGLEEVATLIGEILNEEKAAAEALTRLAERSINRAASAGHNNPPFALI